MSSSTPPNVVFHDHGSSSRASPRINVLENSYPRAIVWGPLGPLTCCCPCVGHMGIGDSIGRIHDFAGPYYIGIDDFMVGCVLRYAVIPSDKDDQAWDESIARADEEYRKRMHNICCDNWCARSCIYIYILALCSDRRVYCSLAQPPSHGPRADALGQAAVGLRRAAVAVALLLPLRPVHAVALPLPAGAAGEAADVYGWRGDGARRVSERHETTATDDHCTV